MPAHHKWPSFAGPLLVLVGAVGLAHATRLYAGESPSQPLATLRATVTDADTQKPAACTVAIIDSTGRIVTERESFKAGFRSTGDFVKQLPPGRTTIRIMRGFETRSIEIPVDLVADKETAVNFRLERLVNLRQRGWFAGDSHAHMLHGEKTVPVDFDFVALTAQAEDLQYLSLAQAWPLDQVTPEKLEAELARRSKADCLLTWNMEAPKNYYRGDAGRCLGHCWTLGMKGRTSEGADVISLLMQASAHDYESDKPSFANFESHQLIHTQGGAVFYSHPARWWMGAWGGRGVYPWQEKMRVSNLAVELPLDTLIGPTYDGLDVITSAGELPANALAFELWRLLLNHGYRLAATASADACFDRPGGAVPGSARTYTYLDEPFSLAAITRATAKGRTFTTTGPLLLVALADKPPGAAFAADGRPRSLTVEAWAAGSDAKGLTSIEVLRNGQTWFTNKIAPPVPSLKTNIWLKESEAAWYCVRVWGGDPQRQRAISGAFFLETANYRPPPPVPARIQANLVDAETGAKLSGTVTEVTYFATQPRAGRKHAIQNGQGIISIPGTARLLAEAPGYQPMTLSPFFDNPLLVETVTRLSAEDLVKWSTFERVRTLLGEGQLTFKLHSIH